MVVELAPQLAELNDHHDRKDIEVKANDERIPVGHRFYDVLPHVLCQLHYCGDYYDGRLIFGWLFVPLPTCRPAINFGV